MLLHINSHSAGKKNIIKHNLFSLLKHCHCLDLIINTFVFSTLTFIWIYPQLSCQPILYGLSAVYAIKNRIDYTLLYSTSPGIFWLTHVWGATIITLETQMQTRHGDCFLLCIWKCNIRETRRWWMPIYHCVTYWKLSLQGLQAHVLYIHTQSRPLCVSSQAWSICPAAWSEGLIPCDPVFLQLPSNQNKQTHRTVLSCLLCDAPF